MPPELAEAQALKSKVQAIAEELKASSKQVFNTTDPDCRHMPSRQGTHASYNVQSVVDDSQGLIVHSDVVSDVNDRGQLGEQTRQANAMVEGRCQTVCADAGYDELNQWKAVEDQGITMVVAPQRGGRDPYGAFNKARFHYDVRRDCYVCPVGQALPFLNADAHGTRRYRIAQASTCRSCAHWRRCTKALQGRQIVRRRWEALRERVEAFYQSPAGQAIYRRRQSRVEHPFGHIKRNLGVQAFLLRGLKGVRAEAGLLASGFNIRRAITILGADTLLASWRAA
jgi:hypothetical protein